MSSDTLKSFINPLSTPEIPTSPAEPLHPPLDRSKNTDRKKEPRASNIQGDCERAKKPSLKSMDTQTKRNKLMEALEARTLDSINTQKQPIN